MKVIVPRTCTEVRDKDSNQNLATVSKPLTAYRESSAYVLLGDPGAGKSTAFETEYEALGEDAACPITARNFLTFDPTKRPEWHGKTLFIDGLDEVRAGSSDALGPFDAIRCRLEALGKPRFRLSCRGADWLGANDRKRLRDISPDSKVIVLRLDQLTDEDIKEILENQKNIGRAETFIREAKERGVYELLKNPQSLKLLVKVVASGRYWPKSRLETFEKACRQLVLEHNEEHQAARYYERPPDPSQLPDVAGRLCAVHLLSGIAGYSLHPSEENDEYPVFTSCAYDSPELLKPALSTKLFKEESGGRFVPVHRHIAEFLGARHLSRIIADGLPSRRILALISGDDGAPVTQMRGLSAWLAALSNDARAELIERDPIGVGLYGDIRGFTTKEKSTLLKFLKTSLNRELYQLGSVFQTAAAFGALMTPEMEPHLRNALTDSNRKEEHQSFVNFLLRVLREGSPLAILSEVLLEIVRDGTRWQGVNSQALYAFLHNCPDNPERTNSLKALLDDIRSGQVSDPDNSLLGPLLKQLYPGELHPSEVWNYLSKKEGRGILINDFSRFWENRLLEVSSDNQVASLLDGLRERLSELLPALQSHYQEDLPLRLLARGLKAHGDKIETARLYDWLHVGSPETIVGVPSKIEEALNDIRSWMEHRPEIQKAVIREGLNRCPDSDKSWGCAYRALERLYGARLPPDFGLWCLHQAIALVDTKPKVAEFLFERAIQALTDTTINQQLSLTVLREQSQDNKKLRAVLERRLSPQPIQMKVSERRREYNEKQRREKEQWLDYVRSNEEALRENRAPPALLHHLAQEYLGDFNYLCAEDRPRAISKRLYGDSGLIDAALMGLRGVIHREDVPSLEEILTLGEQGRKHYLERPFLAGLAEIERTTPEDASQWEDDRIGKALAFYFSVLHGDYRPKWYERLLEARPETVAEVQVRFASSEFRRGSLNINKLWELAHDRHHAQVARVASLRLLRGFPTRCKLQQIQSLDYLLWAAIQHADRASLQKLIGKKLSRKSMNPAQRAHWLAAGFMVAQERYQDRLTDFVHSGRSQQRIRQMAEFFSPMNRIKPWMEYLGISAKEHLIRIFGSAFEPYDWKNESGFSWNPPGEEDFDLIRPLIESLKNTTDQEASDVLKRLIEDPTVSRWHRVLSQTQSAQRVIRRDSGYRHPSFEEVRKTLDGGTPSNAADLVVLVLDRLQKLAIEIRNGNTDDWKQFWNESKGDDPPTPKHEDTCRDALLSDLKRVLPPAIDAQPEGQYANDKRSDIRVFYSGFNVPVEIKKSNHRDLWKAIRNQLIAKYTRDPKTDGYGIYLVFWFGRKYTQIEPSGARPADAQDLKRRLESRLSREELLKISVCVIDVEIPN